MDRAGLLARRQGPWQLLIVLAIRVMLTPRWRNFLNRTGPRFHCFQNRASQAMPDPFVQSL
jgi:hypothetical protein